MDIETRDPRRLKPHPNNSRLHPAEQLAALEASFREFGFNGLVVIDEGDVILAGHGRTTAAIRADLAEIPCKVVRGWSDDKKRAFVIADNQIADGSVWDDAMLLHELQHLAGSTEVDITQFGISLDDLLPQAGPPTTTETMRTAEQRTTAREMPADEAAYREEMADKRTPGQAPIVPMYAEHHQAFVIVCDNEIDEAWIRQRLGLNRPHQSYSDVKILTPNVITVQQLRSLLA